MSWSLCGVGPEVTAPRCRCASVLTLPFSRAPLSPPPCRFHAPASRCRGARNPLASEALAFSSATRRVVTVQDGELLLVTAQGVQGLDPARVTVAEDTKLGTAPVCGTRGT